VNEELATLHRVQELDSEIARREQALAGLDSGDSLEQAIETLRAELTELRQTQESADNESLNLELEVRTLQQRRDVFNTQLYSGRVSNPRQLADLQQEVEMLGREIRRVEDRMLELMETTESRRAQIAAREQQLAELEQLLDAVRARYAEVGGRLRAEMSELEVARQETAQRVSAPLLRRYEQIRGRSANIGVVKVTGTDCPGCHIALPSETLKQLKGGRSGLACDNCARLLFWQAPDEDQGP